MLGKHCLQDEVLLGLNRVGQLIDRSASRVSNLPFGAYFTKCLRGSHFNSLCCQSVWHPPTARPLTAQLVTRDRTDNRNTIPYDIRIRHKPVGKLEVLVCKRPALILIVSSFRSFSPSHPLWRMRTHPIHPPTREADLHPLSHQPHRAQDADQAEEKPAATASPPSLCHQGSSTRCFSIRPHRSCENSRRLGGSTLRLGQWLQKMEQLAYTDLRHSRMHCR